MNFLYPGFLFALFSIAIPILIHLFNFRKFKKVYFSNVAFLKEVKEQNSSKEKLKNLLILACRILAIVFLVFAFARPYRSHTTFIDQSKGNIVSIYIDNSYSMESVNSDGNLLDEAKRKTKEIVKSFHINDRFQLLTNDFEGRHQHLLSGEELLKMLDEVKISPTSRQLQQVLNRQSGIFTGSHNRFVYVISDFQKGFAGDQSIVADTNLHISLIKLKSNPLPNVTVDSVWMLSPVHQANAVERLVIQVGNYGTEDAKNVSVKLAVNDQQKAVSSLNIGAGKAQTDTLSFSGLGVGWQKGVVSLKDFPIVFDDRLNFSFNVSPYQQVLAINGQGSTSFIRTLFSADAYFKLAEMAEQNINYTQLSKYNLIVLNELTQLTDGLAASLKSYLENGGSIVVFPSTSTEQARLSTFLNEIGLPGVTGFITKENKITGIELQSSIFKDVFESLPKQLDLPLVNRYFLYAEQSKVNKESLLTMPGNQLFFGKYTIKGGSVYLAASGLKPEDGNFARHPLFVPMIFKIAFNSVREQALYSTISKDNIFDIANVNLLPNQSLKVMSDGFEAIPEVRFQSGKATLYLADQVKQEGFYRVMQADSLLSILAFNNDRRESDMQFNTESELSSLFAQNSIKVLDPGKDQITSAKGGFKNDTSYWKLCLILSLIFLAIEILLVRFYKIQNHKHT